MKKADSSMCSMGGHPDALLQCLGKPGPEATVREAREQLLGE